MTELELEIERAEQHYRKLRRATQGLRKDIPNPQRFPAWAPSLIDSAEAEEHKALARWVGLEEMREEVLACEDSSPARGILYGFALSIPAWSIIAGIVLLVATVARRFL